MRPLRSHQMRRLATHVGRVQRWYPQGDREKTLWKHRENTSKNSPTTPENTLNFSEIPRPFARGALRKFVSGIDWKATPKWLKVTTMTRKWLKNDSYWWLWWVLSDFGTPKQLRWPKSDFLGSTGKWLQSDSKATTQRPESDSKMTHIGDCWLWSRFNPRKSLFTFGPL